MATKIARATQLQFGSTGAANSMSQFGSFAAGTPTRYSGATVTPANIQALSNFLQGWYGAVVGANAPTIEDMNALCYLFSYQLGYLLQTGVGEWDAATNYFIGSLVNDGTGNLYVSLTNSNLNNAVSNTTNWKIVSSNPFTSLGDLEYSLANGVPARLAGNTTTTPQFLTQTGTGSASQAPTWRNIVSRTMTYLTTGTAATYTPPAGVLYLFVRCWGAGGGGGSAAITTSTQTSLGGGGGSGLYGEKLIAAPSGNYTYTIGAGGAGGTSGSGSNGTATTFSGTGATLSADFGTGGTLLAAATVVGTAVAGQGGSTATGFDFSVKGIAGGTGAVIVAGPTGIAAFGMGAPAPGLIPSDRGLSLFRTGTSTSAFAANASYASGGTGAMNTGTEAAASNGQNGGNGLIIIEEYYQ